jgi:hypothetical protein
MEGVHPSSPIFETLATAIEHPVNWNELAKIEQASAQIERRRRMESRVFCCDERQVCCWHPH